MTPRSDPAHEKHVRRLLLVTVGACVLAGGITVLDRAWPAADKPPARSTTTPPAVKPTAHAAGGAPASAPTQTELALPQPTGYLNGVPVGYPHTTPGAVAAAYGYSRVATGLDVTATLRAVEAMADPASGWFPKDRARIADGLVAQRKNLGLPATGPTESARLIITPSQYRLGPSNKDSVTVLTLNTVSAGASDGTETTGTIVFRWVLRWDGSKWSATQSYVDDADAAAAAAPFTTAAQTAGWQDARDG